MPGFSITTETYHIRTLKRPEKKFSKAISFRPIQIFEFLGISDICTVILFCFLFVDGSFLICFRFKGFDFAFARNGYRYHTKYDNFAAIPLGSYQHVGDNVLELVRKLQDATEIDAELTNTKKSVYYDFIGFILVNYSASFAYVFNLIVSALSFFVALKNRIGT